MLCCVTGKNPKNVALKNNSSNTMSKKIKVKSVSQNHRKKIKKNNLNNTFKESDLLESIMKISNPSKLSQAKMHQTLAFYGHGNPSSQIKYSNRDYLNQSQNSRSSKKKGLAYMKQMMNKTVLIQNQDYKMLAKSIPDRKFIFRKISNMTIGTTKMNKKNSYMFKNDMMVSA